MTTQPSPNFACLAHHDPRLMTLGTQAEEHYASDVTLGARDQLGALSPPDGVRFNKRKAG